MITYQILAFLIWAQTYLENYAKYTCDLNGAWSYQV